jgi:hypothetical protein
MSLVSASTQIADFIQDTQGSEALPPLYLTARFEQLSHIHPKVSASGAAAANAFLFTHNSQTYVVTSAHTLFSEPMSPDAKPPSMMKLGRTELGNMAYSRFFDVAIFQKPNTVNAAAYSSISSGDGSATAHFEDPNADIQFTHVANYTENLNRRTQTGAFFYNLINGSSGSAISRDGKLVAMVAGCDQKYENLTVCVPAQTIVDVIAKIPANHAWSDHLNIDASITQPIFPNMLTAPIPKALRTYFPDDSALSHLVLYAGKLENGTYTMLEDQAGNLILPMTMIEANVANTALGGNGGPKSFTVRPIKSEYRKWFYFPREIVYVERTDAGETFTQLEYGLEATRSDLPSDPSVVWQGMNVTLEDDSQINESNWKTGTATIYPFSSMYFEFMNKDMTTTNSSNDEVSLNEPLTLWSSTNNTLGYAWLDSNNLWGNYKIGTANGTLYKELTLKCLVRHWAFLLMSTITSILDAGNQFIVFATECKRLKGIGLQTFDTFGQVKDYMNDVNFLQMILNKIVEFVDLQALNFFFVLCKVFDIPKSTVDDMKQFFPIDNMNKATSNITEWYDDDGNGTFTMKDTFDSDGNSSFNINGLEAEHYHMIRSGAQSLTAQRGGLASDAIGLELELVYQEITRHKTITEWNTETFLYYPQSFEVVKSTWDHAHVTLGNLLPELSNAFQDA